MGWKSIRGLSRWNMGKIYRSMKKLSRRGRLTPVLSHHRTYRSVYGGSLKSDDTGNIVHPCSSNPDSANRQSEVVDKEGQQPFLLKRYKKTFRRKVSMFRTNSS
uniref:hypothetical protein n=1 Tax=Thermoactinomyces daqus TaxID=1329516 RepID=UPI0035A94658